IYAQHPDAGKILSRGGSVELTVYGEFPGKSEAAKPGSQTTEQPHTPDRAKVPTLVGRSAKEAKAVLAAEGLVAKFQLGSAPPSPKMALVAYAQDPAPGTSLAQGSAVLITIHAPHGTGPHSPAD